MKIDIRPRRDPDHHREGEVLQRRAAEDQQDGDEEDAGEAGDQDRVSTSLIERLTTWEKVARGSRGTFSRIRSNTITVS